MCLGSLVGLTGPEAELAAAVGLVVEVVGLEEEATALAESAPAPILRPKVHIGVKGSRLLTRLGDLGEVLPAGGGEGCGEDWETVPVGILGGSLQADGEALHATLTSLGFVLEALDLL